MRWKVDNVADDTSLFRRYLLGELDESEREDLERSLMTNDEHFQELLIAEDELVDDFCAGRLSASQEQRYRRHFLVTPERRRQHRFGAALRKLVSTEAAQKIATPPKGAKLRRAFSKMWSVPLAAAAVALIAAGVWLILQTQRSPVRLEQTAQRVDGPTVAFFLTKGSLRSTEPETEQSFTVPIGIALVELQLDLPTGTRGDHRVTLEDARSGAIVAEGTLPARTIEGQWVVVAAVPSELLVPGEYRAVLRAPSTDGDFAVVGAYEFRVTSR